MLKHLMPTIISCLAVACVANHSRDPKLVAAEERERLKPLLSPAGGTYYGGVTVHIANFRDGFEIAEGNAFTRLASATIEVDRTRTFEVRDKVDTNLAATETYIITKEIAPVTLEPQPGEYSGTILVTAATEILNAQIEYSSGGSFTNYDPETGIVLLRTTDLALRVCVAALCGPLRTAHYTLREHAATPAPVVSPEDIRRLSRLAQEDYNQKTQTGLMARMDEAKLKVLQDPSLLPNASMRQRFLAQHNDVAAANACTTVARYLYVLAMRIGESAKSDNVFPDFAAYYIRHIKNGDIVTDNADNFVWIMNGSNLVTVYLSPEQRNPFEYQRGNDYPTDFSLLQPVYVGKPKAALLRDSSNAIAGTHTLATVQTEDGSIMIDTFFSAWNGIEARASAGWAWPYAYRFGPAGSRYLHYTYGY